MPSDVAPDAERDAHEAAAEIPGDIPGLEKAVGSVGGGVAAKRGAIRALLRSEDPAAGVFHAAAIHEAKQEHMALRYRRDFCQARLRRLSE